jgi:hypothetical protein
VAAMIKVANMLKCHWEGILKWRPSSINRDLCINMNNHQNAIFHPLDNFMKHSHGFAMTIFYTPIYAKVSQYNSLKRLLWRLGVDRLNFPNSF